VKVILDIDNFNQLIVHRGELKKMANFFLILIGFFIIISNIVGFISCKKKEKFIRCCFYNIDTGGFIWGNRRYISTVDH
ncbi:MAG: hypothetical protein ABS938_17850, partial [Psychrobacillus psychrodurans]